MAFITPKVDWLVTDGVANTDLNRIEGNTAALYESLQFILTVTCDTSMVGKTVTLTKGSTVLSAVVPAGLVVTVSSNELGDWV